MATTKIDRRQARLVKREADARRVREAREAREARQAGALAMVEAATRLARIASRDMPGVDRDDLAGYLVEQALSGADLTFGLAWSKAGTMLKADRRRDAREARASGADQGAPTRARLTVLTRRATYRQVGRLVAPRGAPLSAPLSGIGYACLALADMPAWQARRGWPRLALADLVRHQACQVGAWQGPTRRARPVLTVRDLAGFRALATLVGCQVPTLADLADQAGPMRADRIGQAGQGAAVVAALMADGKTVKTDPDAGTWHEDRVGMRGKTATTNPRSKTRKVARPIAEATPASPRFPRPTGAPLTPDALAAHQVARATDQGPTRLVKEATLARLLDKRHLTSGAPDQGDALADGLSGGWQGAEAAIRWHALATWQAPTDGRGARAAIGQAIARADRADQVRTFLARLAAHVGHPVALADQRRSPVTVGTLAAAHVRGDQVNYSSALRAIGMPTDATHRDALASLVGAAARAATRATDRPYLAGPTRGAAPARTLPVGARPDAIGRRAVGRVGQVAALRDAPVGRPVALADQARLSALTDQAPSQGGQAPTWPVASPLAPLSPAQYLATLADADDQGDQGRPTRPACSCVACQAPTPWRGHPDALV